MTKYYYGWVNLKKNIGKILFFNLISHELEQLQVLTKNENDINNFSKEIKNGDLIKVNGIISNPTGKRNELILKGWKLLSRTPQLPFEIKDNIEINERKRYHYRYLDLRRKSVRNLIELKSNFMNFLRSFLLKKNFLEIPTPILFSPSMEGAKEFFVDMGNNLYYSLSQSPQILKQMLAGGAMLPSFRIIQCFRNEDSRSNRQPEHLQLDLEKPLFGSKIKLMKLVESMFKIKSLKKVFPWLEEVNFEKISYLESMNKYGSDKPDIRDKTMINKIRWLNVNVNIDSLYIAFNINMNEEDENNFLEKIDTFFETGKYFVFSKTKNSFLKQVGNFIKEAEIIKKIKSFSLIISSVGDSISDRIFIGNIRNWFSSYYSKRGLQKKLNFVWIENWPLFLYENEKRNFLRHPFTLPKNIKSLNNPDEKPIITESFDLVINGEEIMSGSKRINNPEIQKQMFKIFGISEEQQNEHFNYFTEFLKYSTSPHGGFGMGIDRFLSVVCGIDNIKEFIAFPKNSDNTCPISDGPKKK